MNWYLEVLKKYAVFSGRAHRTEYWMFSLINFLIAFGLGFLEGALGGEGVLSIVYALAVFLPSLAVLVRRLHDTGRSGWWVLIGLIPLAGAIVLLVFAVLDSEPNANAYGANPKLVPALA
jgi:uncharacterized membrane protein YhaH (DUF805 family)